MRGRKATVERIIRKTIAYARVSTEAQAEDGVSIAAQEERIRAYAAAMGFGVDRLVIDRGESAKSLQRPGMAQILRDIRAGAVERVLVHKLDRLTRSVRDLADLIDLCSRYDVALVSVMEHLDTKTAAGRLLVQLLATIAEWERAAIAERTSSALAYKRRQGQVYGPVPFGYRRAGTNLQPDCGQQHTLERIRARIAAGASLRQVCGELEREGVPAPRGERWYPSSVRAILKSKAYQERTLRLSDAAQGG